MANFKLKVKTNTAAPASGALDTGELGYNSTGKILYVGNTSAAATPLNNVFTGATTTTNGVAGIVPQPLTASDDDLKFLKGNGTWTYPTITTTADSGTIRFLVGTEASTTDTDSNLYKNSAVYLNSGALYATSLSTTGGLTSGAGGSQSWKIDGTATTLNFNNASDVTQMSLSQTGSLTLTTVLSSTYGGTGVNNAGRTLTVNTNSGTLAFSAASTTLTIDNSLDIGGTTGQITLGDSTYTLDLNTTAATTVTLPTSGTLYGTATASITSAQLGTSLSNETGYSSGALAVFSISPSLTTPSLGVATATSINSLALSQTITGRISIGNTGASADYGIAIGASADATGTSSISIGADSEASATDTIAIGKSTLAEFAECIAIGGSGNGATYAARSRFTHSISIGVLSKTGTGTTSQDGNTCVGYNAGPASDTAAYYNSTALGNGAVITSSNNIVLGNSAITYVRCQPGVISGLSDIRDKINIESLDRALDFINQIDTITYERNPRERYAKSKDEMSSIELYNFETYGVIPYFKEEHEKGTKKGNRRVPGIKAQQVYQLLKDTYGTDNYANLVNIEQYDKIIPETITEGITEQYTVSYALFVPFLIKATQEQSQKIENQQKIIDDLIQRIIILENK